MNKNTREYLKMCAKSFPALGHMNGKPVEDKIKLASPDTRHKVAIKLLEKDLKGFVEMSDKEVLKQYKEALNRNKKIVEKRISFFVQSKSDLKKNLKEITKWKAPKDFKQLRMSAIGRIKITIEKELQTENDEILVTNINELLSDANVKDVRNDAVKDLNDKIEVQEDLNRKEIARCKEANRWINKLLKTLDK